MIARVGKYEVLRKVGTGGCGSVFEARDPLIRRTVAVKTCEAKDPEIRARFFQEAQLGGSLRHRNITTVYDFGVDEGMPYIVQEFLDGEDLDRIIARGQSLSLLEKLQILIGIAYGLEYAHNAGIVHRDVKPGNIRILSDGTVKLMDFGIAKLAAMGPYRTGRNMGTLAYLAPERILEQPVDARADVFSFGVVAYELLAGVRPFGGEIEEDLFESIVNAEPAPLAGIAPDVPPAVASIVERALRKAPDDRYPSIEPMRKALLAAFRGLFGYDAPLTATSDHAPGSSRSLRPDASRSDVADTRELPDANPVPEPAADPSPRTPTFSPAPRLSERRPRLAPALLAFAAVAVVAAAVAAMSFRGRSEGLRTRPAASGPAAKSAAIRTNAPGIAAVSRVAPWPPAASVAPAATAATAPDSPGPETAAAGPAAPSDARPNRSARPLSRPDRADARVAVHAMPKPVSRYARAADEPGLSPDTRAAIYLSGAWERYRAGDEPAAREMLTAAFALRRDLISDSAQYDAGFRRLADRVRSEGRRSF